MDMNPLHMQWPLLRRLRERLATSAAVRYDRDAGTIVFHPKRFRLEEVPVEGIVRVEAGNRDDIPGVAWETVFLFFHLDDGEVLVASEHDHGFLALVNDLRAFFPRIVEWREAVPPVQFQLTSVDLWERAKPGRAINRGDLEAEDAA
jgi:hypothetical protein